MTRGLSFFIKLATAALVVGILSKAQAVIIPITFMVVLAFILSGPMKRLHHLGLPKPVALATVMVLFLGIVGGMGYELATQMSDLTTQLTQYNESMRRKVAALQNGERGPLDRIQRTFERVTEGLERTAEDGSTTETIRMVTTEVSAAQRLQDNLERMVAPIASVLIVLVMCVFALGGRDDIRNRLIRLVGPSNLTLTTRALDEGQQRISRYLLDQTMINLGFGVVIGLGLYLIGVPYAALWGGVAAILRYVPYVGAMASMLMPALLAFAIYPGWQETLSTIALFLGLDLLTAYFLEPMLIGHRTGVSSLALLASTLFWTWLWGPLGLVLSTPLTVSLTVLGRHIPQLYFLAVLLGDQAVIGAEISFYQRLLARDEDEANAVAQKEQETHGAAGVMDRVILPTLALAARDRGLKEITQADMGFLVGSIRDIVERLSRRDAAAPVKPVRVLALAANGTESELLLEMLAAVVAPTLGQFEVLSASMSHADVIARIQQLSPEVVCLGFLPPEGGTVARQLCRRIRETFPGLTILTLRPNEPGGEAARAAARMREAGADAVASTLSAASAELTRLLAQAKSTAA